jgi:hypothetical protein
MCLRMSSEASHLAGLQRDSGETLAHSQMINAVEGVDVLSAGAIAP